MQVNTFRLLTESEFVNSNAEFLNNTGAMIVSGSSNEVWYSADQTTTSVSNSGGVRPVVKVSGDLKISGGNGTSELPYTIQGEEPADVGTYITSLKVGEYISLGYTDGSFTMTHVQCFIENDKQVDKVLEMMGV